MVAAAASAAEGKGEGRGKRREEEEKKVVVRRRTGWARKGGIVMRAFFRDFSTPAAATPRRHPVPATPREASPRLHGAAAVEAAAVATPATTAAPFS